MRMEIIGNEKGLTLIELLVSLLIFSFIMSASAMFYSQYNSNMKNMSHHYTAKNFATSSLETEMNKTDQGINGLGVVYSEEIDIAGQHFTVVTKKEDITDSVAYFTNTIPFYKITSTVTWTKGKVEVMGYASSK